MGAYVFRKALIRTMADIQAAEIDSHCQGNAFFQSARDGSHERPPLSCANWEDGCRDGNDTAIIRLVLLAMAEISDPRWHRLPKRLLDYARLRRLREPVCRRQMELGFTRLATAFDRSVLRPRLAASSVAPLENSAGPLETSTPSRDVYANRRPWPELRMCVFR